MSAIARTFGTVGFLLAGTVAAQANFVVHEWGTFTSVVGSDGRMLPGLEVEEERVPAFVLSHAGFAPRLKGFNRPVSGVTIKMETPVLYFYSAQPMTVRVDVGFRGGSISQWYPERVGGEQLPGESTEQLGVFPVIDFAAGFKGSASWQVDVLAPNEQPAYTAVRAWETPQWPRARVESANRLRGPKGEVEGFIFYRGVGNFSLPLTVTATGNTLTLRNTGHAPIPFAFVWDQRAPNQAGTVGWEGPIGIGETRVVKVGKAPEAGVAMPADERTLMSDFPRELQRAGLTEEEARAMLATWHESYFQRAGLRVFWIVPRTFTDAVLPLTITPRPRQLERVLVGRTEVLTPSFEAELLSDFARDGGKRWETDRYFRAYRERARQLGVVDVALPSKGL